LILAHVLDSGKVVLQRGAEPVHIALLNDGANLLVERDPLFRLGHLGLSPFTQIGPHAEHPAHADVKAKFQRQEILAHVGHPGFHRSRWEDVREARLNGQARGWDRVVAHPDLVRMAQNPQVGATPTAGAALPGHMRVPLAQGLPDMVDALDVAHPQLARLDGGVGPTGLAHIPIHVPFDVGDVIVGQQPVDPVDDVLLYLRFRHVQNELVAALRARARREMDDPVRMLAVELAVRVDHLRLDPESEVHAELIHTLD